MSQITADVSSRENSAEASTIRTAHAICPYSNAIRGNIEVPTAVFVREAEHQGCRDDMGALLSDLDHRRLRRVRVGRPQSHQPGRLYRHSPSIRTTPLPNGASRILPIG